MKKTLIGLAVLLLIPIAGFFYQRHRMQTYATQTFIGKSFSSYGFDLKIPSQEARWKGWLQPRLVVRNLSFQVRRLPFPVLLNEAEIDVGLTRKTEMPLVVNEIPLPEEGKIEKLQFLLTPQGRIRQLGFQSLQIRKTSDTRFTLRSPRLEMDDPIGIIPGRFVLKIDGIEYLRTEKPSPTHTSNIEDTFQWGPIELGLSSTKTGEKVEWKFFSKSEGGNLKLGARQGKVDAWDISLQGQANEVDYEKARDLFGQIKKDIEQIVTPLKKRESPATIQESIDRMVPIYRRAVAFLLDIEILPQSSEARWGGLRWTDDAQQISLAVSPIRGRVAYRCEPQRFSAEGAGTLEGMQWKKGLQRFELEAVEFAHSSSYEISYRKLCELGLRYYEMLLKRIGNIKFPAEPMLSGLPPMYREYLTALSVYPDQFRYDVKIKRLDYESARLLGQHRNVSFSGELGAQGTALKAGDEFDHRWKDRPRQNLQGAKADLQCEHRYPWQSWLQSARTQLEAQRQDFDLPAFFSAPNDLNCRAEASFGADRFVAKSDLRLLLNLKDVLSAAGTGTLHPPLPDEHDLALALKKVFLETGTFEYNLRFEKFSRLQDWMSFFPDWTTRLMKLMPYLERDTPNDTATLQLRLQDKQILLNGKPDAALEAALFDFLSSFH